jgi:hypothetical protein
MGPSPVRWRHLFCQSPEALRPGVIQQILPDLVKIGAVISVLREFQVLLAIRTKQGAELSTREIKASSH